MLRILHIAPINFAGVPYDFYRMHNAAGDFSRIVTLHKNPLSFSEDINLDLPLHLFPVAQWWRKKKVAIRSQEEIIEAPLFTPNNIFERNYFSLEDFRRRPIIENARIEYLLDSFDIIHYDGGLDCYRNSSLAKEWKRAGKKIVCCYYGSDLRIRGLIPEMDAISDLNLTSEYDHLALKNDLHYLFYPYDPSELPKRSVNESDTIKIVHSPTNRRYKGTDLIIRVIERVKKERKIEFILLENMPRDQVLTIKRTCDICVDQVGGTMGGTGYGKAGIEMLAMGIPVITNMTDDYKHWLPENPFVVANNEEELFGVLMNLIDNAGERKAKGETGKEWVERYHGFSSVNQKLYELYRLKGIID